MPFELQKPKLFVVPHIFLPQYFNRKNLSYLNRQVCDDSRLKGCGWSLPPYSCHMLSVYTVFHGKV